MMRLPLPAAALAAPVSAAAGRIDARSFRQQACGPRRIGAGDADRGAVPALPEAAAFSGIRIGPFRRDSAVLQPELAASRSAPATGGSSGPARQPN